MSGLGWLTLLLGLALVAADADYQGYRIYEVTPATVAQSEILQRLSQEGYDFFSLGRALGHPARLVVSPQQLESFEALLAAEQLNYRLLNGNLGATIAEEFAQRQMQRRLLPITGKGRLATDRYYSHGEINNYIDDLAARYPTRVLVKTVGWSYERREMKTITITNGDGRANKKVVFLDGGFHAREWISPAAVLYIIEQLVEEFAENEYLLKDYDWVVLPVVNPDGYEHTQTGTYARIFRKTRQPYRFLTQTCYGADPNRNFDFHWNEEGASSNPCMDTYAGPSAFSEPETIVVRDLMHSLADRGIMYLTMHSYGNYLLYPWGWTSDLPDTVDQLDAVASAGGDAIKEATGTVYTVGSSTNVLYIAAGASDDYAFYAGFNISITMELSGGGVTGFDPPASSINEYVTETWIGVRAMAEKLIELFTSQYFPTCRRVKMRLFLFTLCSLLIAQSQGKGSVYDGFKVYELSAKGRSADLVLAELVKNESYYELFSNNGASAHVMVHPDAQPEFVELLDEHTLNYKIVNRDVGLTLRREFEMNRNLRNWFPYQGRLGTERFYTHDEINQYLDDLAQQYPSRVFVKTVGKSYEGRWLKTIRITNGDGRANKNVILMDGGFHAREWIAHASVVYAIGELVENYEEYAQLLLDYDWVVLPVVNADGYVYTHLSADTRFWRKTRQPSSDTCIGTDPNRNFDFHWNETGASSNPCAETYAGPKAFSEPEAVVVRDLIHELAARGKMYLTIHSYGNYLLHPWGYVDALPDTWPNLDEVGRAGADAIQAATGTVYAVGGSTALLYAAAGASDDYAFNAGFPISFTMELPAGGTGFDPPASDIDRLVKETWIGIEAMGRKVVEKYPLNAGSGARRN
ncbi:uncharacterized protein LOC117572446 [Drosophila albomicans]|uniref:Uncharacterized protein LOC117572446 n=1 Tax=Drosophila albomicans TaxID=7291 RepID=A0A9C6W9A0_DROAB|nr:uncharacterized protein LOC117572446 [Drosophila albomicans]